VLARPGSTESTRAKGDSVGERKKGKDGVDPSQFVIQRTKAKGDPWSD